MVEATLIRVDNTLKIRVDIFYPYSGITGFTGSFTPAKIDR